MAFNCVIVTPEQQVLDQQVSQVIFPAYDGQVGILTDRAPLLAKLGIGALRLTTTGNQERVYFVEGGIAQMKDNNLTILTNEAVPAEQIDAETARAELAEATARRITDENSYNDRDRRMRRARAMQELAASR
jgi:F-type H+-transporting ATPase subunit epsilon